MKPGAIVWTMDMRGVLRLGKVMPGEPIETSGLTYYQCARWRRSQGKWGRTSSLCAVFRELTDEEQRQWSTGYEPPTVIPVGNLRDLLEHVPQIHGWAERRRKAVG